MSIITPGHSEFRKGGGGLHRLPDLVLITADGGSHPKTSQVSLETISTTQFMEENADDGTLHYSLHAEERFADKAPHTDMVCWIPYKPLRPLASEGTPMFLKTHYIVFKALLPQTTTPSAQRRLAEYPRVYYLRRRRKLFSREATAQLRTLYTQDESRTRPTPTRPTSTKGHVPSSS